MSRGAPIRDNRRTGIRAFRQAATRVSCSLRFLPGGPVLAVLVLACQSRSTDDDLVVLNRLQQQVDSAIIAGDTERYLTFLTDDAVLMPPNGPAVSGKEAIGNWNRAISQQVRITNYTSRDEEIVVAGDWAFRRAAMHWTLTPVPGGAGAADSGKYIILYRRQPDGSWKVARDMWSSNTIAR